MRRRLLSGAVAGVSAAALMAWGRDRERISGLDWRRSNHAGRSVTLWEGAAFAKGTAIGAAAAGAPAAVVASLGSAVFGALDDHAGNSTSKGLKGHLGALTRGEVTTGAVKILGIGATGLAAAAVADRRSGRGLGVHSVIGGAVIAAAANFGNLLDLRPGRTLKVTVLTGAPLLTGAGGVPSAAVMGAAAGVIGPDLRGESMLGDTGANAAGAVIGVAAVEQLGPRGRLITLALLTALTVASEKVSFTRVIESTPVLRELDAWGRPR